MKRLPVIFMTAVILAAIVAPGGGECLLAGPARESKVSSVPAEEIPDWLARWELARTLGYAKRYDESVAEYRKLLKERPDLPKARIEMAKVLFWQKKDQEALAVLEGVDARQFDVDSLLLMADLYRDRKSYGKAAPLYREYLQKRTVDDAARLRYAEMLSWEKRYDESLAEYRTILTRLPDDAQVRRKYALVLMWAKRYGEAAAELRKTLK